MKVLWSRVVALALAVVGMVVLVQRWPEIVGAVKSVDTIGPAATPDELLRGLIALGVIAFCVIAVVRVLVHQPKK